MSRRAVYRRLSGRLLLYPCKRTSDAGVISGYNTSPPCDNSSHIPCFKPYNTINRGQASKIIVLGANYPVNTTGGPHFTDVPADHPFYQYIETAYHEEIISGYSDGTFRPGNNITRGQFAKIVVLAFNFAVQNPGTPTFSDVETDHPFYAFIESAYSLTLISGYSDGTFRPYNDITRGQAAKIVHQGRLQSAPTPTRTATPTRTPTNSPTPTSTTTVAPTMTETALPTATQTAVR
jgi:hypothetical protein